MLYKEKGKAIIDIDNFCGKPFPFHGVDNNRFRLGGTVFEVFEDPDDGYRSYLDCVVIDLIASGRKDIFFKHPLATVVLEELTEEGSDQYYKDDYYYGDDGKPHLYQLRDVEDDHIWLFFGEDAYDRYYPFFVFRYTPKKPNQRKESIQ